MSEKKRIRKRYRSEREGKRKADSTARTNRENVHVYWSLNHLCLRSTCSHPTPFSSASLPVPCNPAESHSLSSSLSLRPHLASSLGSLLSRFCARLLVIIIIHSILARGVAKVTILLLATSPYAGYIRVYRVSRGICNRLLLFSGLVLSTICPRCIISAEFSINF